MAGGSPRYRRDLQATNVEADGVVYVEVTDPQNGRGFRFYEFEHTVALALDGRPLPVVADDLRTSHELDLTAEQLAAFAEQLEALGFLEEPGPAAIFAPLEADEAGDFSGPVMGLEAARAARANKTPAPPASTPLPEGAEVDRTLTSFPPELLPADWLATPPPEILPAGAPAPNGVNAPEAPAAIADTQDELRADKAEDAGAPEDEQKKDALKPEVEPEEPSFSSSWQDSQPTRAGEPAPLFPVEAASELPAPVSKTPPLVLGLMPPAAEGNTPPLAPAPIEDLPISKTPAPQTGPRLRGPDGKTPPPIPSHLAPPAEKTPPLAPRTTVPVFSAPPAFPLSVSAADLPELPSARPVDPAKSPDAPATNFDAAVTTESPAIGAFWAASEAATTPSEPEAPAPAAAAPAVAPESANAGPISLSELTASQEEEAAKARAEAEAHAATFLSEGNPDEATNPLSEATLAEIALPNSGDLAEVPTPREGELVPFPTSAKEPAAAGAPLRPRETSEHPTQKLRAVESAATAAASAPPFAAGLDEAEPRARSRSWLGYAALAVAAALVISGMAYKYFESNEPPPVTVKTMVPAPSTVYRFWEGTGRVELAKATPFAFSSDGRLAEIVPSGTRFAAGDTLAMLDSGKKFVLDLERAKARLTHYEKMRDDMTAAGNRAELRQAELKIVEKKRLIAEAQANIAKHALIANEAGEVAEVLVSVGVPIKAGAPVLRTKGTAFHAVFELPREDADKARQLGFCRVEIDGKALDCSLAANGGDETHVVIELPSDPAVAEGKTARLARDRLEAAFTLPTSALDRVNGTDRVYVVGTGNRAELRSVSVADRSETDAIITQGIDVGDRVIVNAPPNLRPETRVLAE
jgi:hypothetical protein